MKLLVDAGADINIKMGTSGQTPLHLAVEYDCIDIISYLLNNVSPRCNILYLAAFNILVINDKEVESD